MKTSGGAAITKPRLNQELPLKVRLEMIAEFLEKGEMTLMARDVRLAIDLINKARKLNGSD